MRLPPDTAESTGPNLTPVIDVVFLLLIFFLVATTYDKEDEEKELDLVLAEVAAAQPVSVTDQLVINVMHDGQYRVAGRILSERQLAKLIAEVKKNNPHQTASIRGDRKSELQHSIRVMSLCNQVGMEYHIRAIETGDVRPVAN